MREGKERKRLNFEKPDYPLDNSGNYRIIHIEDMMNGIKTEHILMLTPSKNGRCDSWDVWLDAEYQGYMGWHRAVRLAENKFFRVRSN